MSQTLPSPDAPENRRLWTGCAVLVASVLTILQKPWALLNAQLWAEDGSVHLIDQTLHGAGAFFLPYRGYLHLLPRLIAWLAAHTSPVVYWPLFYNAAALLVAVGIYVRYASPRLPLPGKPWLIMGFALVAANGEVFLNITNLHWLTSFLILAQVFIEKPKTRLSALADVLILAICGLTGPFIIVYLPLLAWRCWRDRDGYSYLVGAIALTCAATQGCFLAHEGAQYFTDAPTSDPWMFVGMVGLRMVIWPYLGPRIGLALPVKAMALLGVVGLTAVVLSAVRKGPTRRLRLEVLAAVFLIGAICMYRIRPDTWENVDLDNGDSYFFIPKVLILWLVIWTFRDAPSWARRTAKAAVVLGILLNLTAFIKPAPPDFDWPSHCSAILAGCPANIPILPEGWILQYPGKRQYVAPRDDWWIEEGDHRHWWRWSAGSSTVTIASETNAEVSVRFKIKAASERQVTIKRGDQVLWSQHVGTTLVPVSLTLPSPKGTPYTVSFTSDRPPVMEKAKANPRRLAFAIYDWKVGEPGG